LTVLLALAALGGCAKYEYDVVKPAELAQHVGGKSPVRLPIGDLEYALQSYDNHLVMIITNRAAEAVKLLGGDSYVVDPKGESHPLTDRVIPPGSHVKLILPPVPQQVREDGPRFGVGVGVGISNAGFPRHGRYGYGGGMHDDLSPRYYSIYDPNDATMWKWDGDGTEARIVLTFEKGKDRFSDEFVFRRKKV
jgi:hypothetical protein